MRLNGLIAATFTPMQEDGSLNLSQVPAMVDYLVSAGLKGLYVCGSTGEGPLLTTAERKATAEAYVKASAGRIPVIIQSGHASIAEAKELSAHAQAIGADALSAIPPTYFKPSGMDNLIACLAEITSAAPDLPFYYYHIPKLTDVSMDMVEFLKKGAHRIPSLAGIKFSDRTIETFQACSLYKDGKFNILFGADETLLSALVVGAEGAVGSTYNFLAPLDRKIETSFKAGNSEKAAALQAKAVEFILTILNYRGMAGLKATMKLIGIDCGPVRLPLEALNEKEIESLRKDLDALGFFEWTK